MEHQQALLSPDLASRLAAIDIGTNSIRLVVAEGLRSGKYRILDEERESTRLGRKLDSTGMLDDQAVEESLAALRRFSKIAEGFYVENLRTIATCAVRESKNGPEFCHRALAETGLDIEVIGAEQEARLAFYSVRRSFDLSGRNVALADIGGGSTEVVLASGNMIEAIYATDLGAVRISEKHGGGQAMAGRDFDRMKRWIDKRLRKKTKAPGLVPHVLIGSGGTFTSLASMVMAEKNQSGLPVRGYQMTRAEVKHLVELLRKMTPKARRNVTGLNPDRADIIVPGLVVVDRIMRHFKVNLLQVHNQGVRDGLLLTMIDQVQGNAKVSTPDRDAAVDRFALACGADLKHGRHAANLCGQIFSQLAEPFQLLSDDRVLLEAAARLQDVGYLINYTRHHQHGYHLILNSRLEGFQAHELELLANVARYHRGTEPKKKHANFRQLVPKDRLRVRQLAAILRLAGGLDRTHSQQIRSVRVEVREGDVELRVEADTYPDVDLWGARRRAGLFEKVFHSSVTIEWDHADREQLVEAPKN